MACKDNHLIEQQYQLILERSNALDNLQAALDVVGLEPTQTVGSAADIANSIISLLRSAFSKTKDEREKHIINAGISAVSILPVGDLIKVLKLKQFSKPLTKATIQTTKTARAAARGIKAQGTRFDQ